MTRADVIVNETLFGVAEIEHEPGNYFLHRDSFKAAIEHAVAEERERCAKIAETVVGDFERDTSGRTETMVRRGIADAIRKGE